MAIGGFNGSDPSPTLARVPGVRRRRRDPLVHRGGGGRGGWWRPGGGPNAGGSTSSEIATWVSETFEAQTVDGVTVYDLSRRGPVSALPRPSRRAPVLEVVVPVHDEEVALPARWPR